MRFRLNCGTRTRSDEILKISLALLLSITFPLSGLAQSTTNRPRVGMALSGGGALGLAHIGVLKVMEEAGLRPDYISGVSMGSIIGGLYSIGYSADSIKAMVKKTDWDLILSNKIPENKVIFSEKKHFNNYIISLPVSLKKITLPQGLINGQQTENILNFYLWPAADINDFSELPIPFLCLATDMITFREKVLTTGYLPDAIRASIAVPSVFTPIKIDTLLLADGGLIRNIAVEELKKEGAEIIIASYTGFHTYSEKDLQSVSGIIKQISLARSAEDYQDQKKFANLVIEPKFHGLQSTEFKKADSIIMTGYMAALPFKTYFKHLTDSLNNLSGQAPLRNILHKELYRIDRIEINGNDIYSDQQILGILDISPGEMASKYMLSTGIELLCGKEWFEKIKYRFVPRNDSLILVIDCVEKPKAVFCGSVHYDNALGAGILASFSIKNLITSGSVISLDSYIAQYYRIRNTFIQYLSRSQRFGLSFDFYSDNTLIPKLNLKNETGDVLSNILTAGFGINRMIGLNQMMNIIINFEKSYLAPQYLSESELDHITYNYLTAAFNYRINTLDTKHFPGKGLVLDLSAGSADLLSAGIKTYYSATDFNSSNPGGFGFDRFHRIKINYREYFRLHERVTFSISADGLFISECDSAASRNNFFLLGGISSLNERSVPAYGFHPNEIAVKKIAGIGLGLDWEATSNLYLTVAGNIFAIQEAEREAGFSILSGYGIGIGYMSIIGPVKAGIVHGFYDREKYFNGIKAFISVGYLF